MRKIILVANTGFALYHFRLPLMKYLISKEFEVIAISFNEADYDSKFTKQGIKFIDVTIDHKGKNPLKDLFLILNLIRIYRQELPDIVHHFTIKPVIFGSIAAKIAGITGIVNTITGLGYVFEKRGWLQAFTTMLYKIALCGSPRVLFQNMDDQALFLKKNIVVPKQSGLTLGSGVDTKLLAPTPKKHFDLPLTFLLVGRMLWPKGINEYVNAARIVKQRYPETRFIIVGGASGGGAKGNPQAIPYEWLKSVDKEGVVKWKGRLPFSKVMELMDEAKVVVLPTYYPEGVPKTLIEAASKGKAIITTDTPGCRDVVVDGENGYLVKPRDPKTLALRMIKFIECPELCEIMGRAGRKKAVELFDEKIVFKKTIQVYLTTFEKNKTKKY